MVYSPSGVPGGIATGALATVANAAPRPNGTSRSPSSVSLLVTVSSVER